MKKFPFQLLVNTFSLCSVALFVWWTSHGSLKSEVTRLFGKIALHDSVAERAGHIGDLLFYFSIIVFVILLAYTLMRLGPAKLNLTIAGWLPNLKDLESTLREMLQQLIVFLGVYIYLLHLNGGTLVVI